MNDGEISFILLVNFRKIEKIKQIFISINVLRDYITQCRSNGTNESFLLRLQTLQPRNTSKSRSQLHKYGVLFIHSFNYLTIYSFICLFNCCTLHHLGYKDQKDLNWKSLLLYLLIRKQFWNPSMLGCPSVHLCLFQRFRISILRHVHEISHLDVL